MGLSIIENTLTVTRFLDETARVRTMASVAKLASEPHDDYTSNNFERGGNPQPFGCLRNIGSLLKHVRLSGQRIYDIRSDK